MDTPDSAALSRERSAPRPASVGQTAARLGLGALLLFTGTAHLTFWRRQFVAQVPESLPLDTDFVVVSSGIAELAMGTALVAASRQRVPVGLAVASFFVAVFPGNVSQYLNRRSAFGLDTDNKRFARLFFQPLLVAWALWSTGADSQLRRGVAGERSRRRGAMKQAC